MPMHSIPSTSSPFRRVLLPLLVLCIFLGFSRFAHLGDKVFHHDESLFAYYGWYLAFHGDYEHDPLLHGPLQIQTLAALFRVARAADLLHHADALARFPAALAGCLIVFPLLALGRWMGRAGAWFAVALAACSPGMWYYARFCRNESLFLLFTALAVWAVATAWRARRPGRWIVLAAALVAVLVSIKENALFLLFSAATFFVFAALVHRRDAVGVSPWRTLRRSFVRHRYAWLSAAALALLILEAVYTCGFQWPRSFGPFYLDILLYWLGQHREHRLYGDFHYYLPLLAVYEPLVVLALGAAVARSLARPNARFARWGLVVALGGACILAVRAQSLWARGGLPNGTSAPPLAGPAPLLQTLHMTRPWHLAWAAAVGWLTLWGAARAFRSGRAFRAWLVWWTGLSLLQYSYAGEKVPWLSLHIALPAILLAADLLAVRWAALRPGSLPRAALLAAVTLLCGWNLIQGVRLCFLQPDDPVEWLVYNHTDTRLLDVAEEMAQAARRADAPGAVLLQGEANWPLVWYLRDTDYRYIVESEPPDLDGVGRLACDAEYARRHLDIGREFSVKRLVLRRAWASSPLPPIDADSGPVGVMKALWTRLFRISDYVLFRRPWDHDETWLARTYFLYGLRRDIPAERS